MARIPMTSGFTLIPEGTYVFRIYDAKYDEEFGKIEVKLVNAQGMTHTERFSIKDKNDEYNEKALNAFPTSPRLRWVTMLWKMLTRRSLSTITLKLRSFIPSSLPPKTRARPLPLPISVTKLRLTVSIPSLWLVR